MKEKTNNVRDILLSIFIILCFVALCPLSIYRGYKIAKNKYNTQEKDTVIIYKDYKITDAKWDRFTKALIWVESKGYSNAVGSDGDVGVLQIKKVMVDECNRIVGYKHFKYEDRLDSIKSVQMFNIVQEHYNPKRNIHLALKIWNSKADLKYHKKVEKRYNEICNDE